MRAERERRLPFLVLGGTQLSLPLPLPDTIGDVSATLAASLTVRPLEETARDTLRWLKAGNGPVTGLTAAEEATLLAAWHAERG